MKNTANTKLLPLAALIAVTMVWGVTFVEVKSALSTYPLLAFLTLRFMASAAFLAPFGLRQVKQLGLRGVAAGAATGIVIAGAFLLQSAGLERTSVSATGFITGSFVVLTPLVSVALFHTAIGRSGWCGVIVTTLGLALLTGVHGGAVSGDLLVLGGAVLFAVQTALMERFASHDALPLTLVQMIAASITLATAAGSRGHFPLPHSDGVISAILVTGFFASALGFLAQNWAQRRISATQTALSLSLEPVWTAIFGVTLAGDQFGTTALFGSTLILGGLVISEAGSTTLGARHVLTATRRRRPPDGAFMEQSGRKHPRTPATAEATRTAQLLARGRLHLHQLAPQPRW
jgi:drug/metabolite transporter (DMT)-like permease